MTLVSAVTAVLVAVSAPFGLTPTGPSTAPVVKCWNVQGNWEKASKKSCEVRAGKNGRVVATVSAPPVKEDPKCDHKGKEKDKDRGHGRDKDKDKDNDRGEGRGEGHGKGKGK